MDRVVDVARLFRKTEETREGKYLVQRRDGTVPEWPYFVLGAADPAAPNAIRSYAYTCRQHDMDPEYINDLMDLAQDFEDWRYEHGTGDPDAPKHRKDDPDIIAKMQSRHGA